MLDDKEIQPVSDSLLTVALVAHTDAAFALLESSDFARSRQQIVRAQSYAEKIQSKNRAQPLVRQWWPVAIGYMHAERNYVGAARMIERARALSGDTPELLLAAGVTNELIAMGSTGRPHAGAPQLGSFEQAETAFKSALAADPSLLEARLRLARVRTLRGDSAASARMLAEFQTPDDRLFSYLARISKAMRPSGRARWTRRSGATKLPSICFRVRSPRSWRSPTRGVPPAVARKRRIALNDCLRRRPRQGGSLVLVLLRFCVTHCGDAARA